MSDRDDQMTQAELDALFGTKTEAKPERNETEEEYNARVEKERYLDPLHVQTPMLQRVQRDYPRINTGAGTANWAVLANYANLIVDLRTRGLSTPDIEERIRESAHNFFGAIYQHGLVKRG